MPWIHVGTWSLKRKEWVWRYLTSKRGSRWIENIFLKCKMSWKKHRRIWNNCRRCTNMTSNSNMTSFWRNLPHWKRGKTNMATAEQKTSASINFLTIPRSQHNQCKPSPCWIKSTKITATLIVQERPIITHSKTLLRKDPKWANVKTDYSCKTLIKSQ